MKPWVLYVIFIVATGAPQTGNLRESQTVTLLPFASASLCETAAHQLQLAVQIPVGPSSVSMSGGGFGLDVTVQQSFRKAGTIITTCLQTE